MSSDATPTLLIVDDESSVCRALRRVLKDRVPGIVTASTIADAELVLDTRAVTHVLCDHLLGPGQPRGMEVACLWKARYPSLRRVVILTGTSAAHGDVPAGIDHVAPKSMDPHRLCDLLDL